MRRSIAAIAGIALIGIFALTACGSEMPGDSTSQDKFVESILHDRSYLFPGYAMTVASVRTPVNTTYRLTLKVCGSRQTCGVGPSAPGSPSSSPASPSAPASPSESASPPPGEMVAQVGGMISGRLTSNMPGTITPLDLERQPVIEPTDRAQWRWEITPNQAGTYELDLHVTVLHAETNDPLVADQIITIPLTVDQTAANTARQTWSGIKEIAAVLSAFGVTVIGAIGAVVVRIRKRRRAKAAESAEGSSP